MLGVGNTAIMNGKRTSDRPSRVVSHSVRKTCTHRFVSISSRMVRLQITIQAHDHKSDGGEVAAVAVDDDEF